MGSGAGKSGNPWARLTPPSRAQTRDISRMTDSVNLAALIELRERMRTQRTTFAARLGQLVRPLAPGPGILAQVLVGEPSQGFQEVQPAISADLIQGIGQTASHG